MHNMDRIMNEELGQEYGLHNEGEGEWEWEGEGEWEGEWEGEGEWEWEGEWEGEGEGEWEWEGEGEWEFASELSEENLEYELAAELLAVTNEGELDQFLGKLVSSIGRGVSRFARSGVGRKLIGGLKAVAKKALPIAGGAVGTFFGGPMGGAIGGKLGSMASRLFEVQMEGLSPEDREFEVARRYVRFARTAAQNAAANASRPAPPKKIAYVAMKKAAAKHAPGLVRPPVKAAAGPVGSSGRWVRKGNRIIILGL